MFDMSELDLLPEGCAGEDITEGCLVLEGGAWRGMYTQGVLDALMEEDINFQTTVGVSAGALSSIGYLSGQIGYTVRINLKHRHDQNYVGLGAMAQDHGITGFSYLFGDIMNKELFDEGRFFEPERRLLVTATNIETGKEEFFEKGKCTDIFKAIQASATVPYISEAVEIDGNWYLDGGIGCKIPYYWPRNEGFSKVVVVRTRDRKFRKVMEQPISVIRQEYKKYPELRLALEEETPRYNLLLDRLDVLEEQGDVFVLAPSVPVEISRFEGDLEALSSLYWLGYHDTKKEKDRLLDYLNS